MNWAELDNNCKNCTRCSLSSGRLNVVSGRGNKSAPILFVGEAPGEQEDLQGKPFVGDAGQILNLLLTALQFKPEHYYITNVVKCRPPQNRTPSIQEAEACLPYLRNEFTLLNPKIIVCLGAVASNYLFEKGKRISEVRGIWQVKKDKLFISTYHPAALLRDETKKMDMWQDMKNIRNKLTEILS